MENAAQSTRPDARIIHLRTQEKPVLYDQHEASQPTILDIYSLEYIDQLLDEHFK